MKITQILDKIDEKQLFIPAFQREYVWTREDAKELVSSLIKEYPTGTMLTWETNNPPELKGKWKYQEKQGAVKLILDGQQRITTLYLLIRGDIPPYYKPEEIVKDPRNLFVNVETLELQYYKKLLMTNNPRWVKLTDIFKRTVRAKDVVKALRSVQEVPDNLDDAIDDSFRAIEKIPDRDFVELSIPVKANIKEAIDIFYIVNAGGVNLTEAELALAQICGYWPEARERLKRKLSSLEKEGFVFKLDFLVYALMGVLHHGGSELRKLHSADNKDAIQEAWAKLENSVLDYVFSLLRTHAYVDHTKEINSVYALIPVIVYCYRRADDHLSQEEIAKIVKWFYYSQIRQRFANQMPTKLDKDIGILVNSDNPFDDLLSVIRAERPLEITVDEFVGVADIRHPLWSLMRWYFKSRDAVCFTTGVGLRGNMGKKYTLEWDHIFAYSVLKEAGYTQDNRLKYALAQEITNRAVLTQVANRKKAAKTAEVYLADIEPDLLKRQAIPLETELWKLENYERFLAERRRMLAHGLNEFLESITSTHVSEVETPIEELIADGESGELEFKASLLWSYKESKRDKKLEQVVAKTIAAFANADGGVLLIGVQDEGELLGLENDYSLLGGTKDEFELHLRNIVRKNFGESFAATSVSVSFPTHEGFEVCKVEVKSFSSPLYVSVKDKNGVQQQKFYVRSGNSSAELPISEANDYCRTRFA